jgi:multicomponent Na+:H+ antiporter subunit E
MALKPGKKPSNVCHWYTQYRDFRIPMRFLILFTTLMAGWLLMSGIYNGLLIGFGVASCLLCTWLSLRIGATDREGLPTHLFARLPAYLAWLIGEIVSSNIATAKIILRGTSDPEIFEVPANQATAAGLANYANSITLTPGTVTVDIDEAKTGPSRFLVHALHPQFGDDVRSGDMDKRNCALEGAGSGRSGKSGK